METDVLDFGRGTIASRCCGGGAGMDMLGGHAGFVVVDGSAMGRDVGFADRSAGVGRSMRAGRADIMRGCENCQVDQLVDEDCLDDEGDGNPDGCGNGDDELEYDGYSGIAW